MRRHVTGGGCTQAGLPVLKNIFVLLIDVLQSSVITSTNKKMKKAGILKITRKSWVQGECIYKVILRN